MVQFGAGKTPQMYFARDFNKEKKKDLNGPSVSISNTDH